MNTAQLIMVIVGVVFIVLFVAILGRSLIKESRIEKQLKCIQAGLCPKCGYDLRASPTRCSECGADGQPEYVADVRVPYATGGYNQTLYLAYGIGEKQGQSSLQRSSLMAALAILEPGFGSIFLTAMGVDVSALAQRLAPGVTTVMSRTLQPPLTAQTIEVIVAARIAADKLKSKAVGVEHLILALVADGKFVESLSLDSTRVNYPIALSHVYNSKAQACLANGDEKSAIEHLNFAMAVHLSPTILNCMAWILSTSSNEELYRPAEANELARQAYDLCDGKIAGIVDTLANTYAAIGNFPEAIRLGQQAVSMATGKDLELCQANLRLFENGKSFREPAKVTN